MLSNYLVNILICLFSKSISSYLIQFNYPLLILRGVVLANLAKFLSICKYSSLLRLNTLTELTAYDYPARKLRFTLNVFLLSVEYNYRLALNLGLSESSCLPTLANVYPNSNWSERELRDMFGLYFLDNKDLRRLLTDYGFEGFPLRKDFPLTGYLEVRYDDEAQQILYETVELAQEFRLFSLTSPWEQKI